MDKERAIEDLRDNIATYNSIIREAESKREELDAEIEDYREMREGCYREIEAIANGEVEEARKAEALAYWEAG